MSEFFVVSGCIALIGLLVLVFSPADPARNERRSAVCPDEFLFLRDFMSTSSLKTRCIGLAPEDDC